MLIGEEEDSYLGDFILDDDVFVLFEVVVYLMLKEQFLEVLDFLNEREKKVLKF